MSLRLNITPKHDILYIVLPGVSQGAGVGILKTITDRLEIAKKEWLAVTFPFQDEGQNSPESPEHTIEIAEVMRGLKIITGDVKPERVVIIGKSFGALIGSNIITNIRLLYECAIEFHILGFIFEDSMRASLESIEKLFVYQGEFDRFGSPEKVSNILKTARVVPIVGADHSYRNEKKEPVFESIVVDKLFENMTL